MSEQETLSEALSNLNDDNIQKAAVPEHKRESVDEIQEGSTFIDLDDDDLKDVAPITDDKVKDDFEEGALGEDDVELSEVEKEAKKAQGVAGCIATNPAFSNAAATGCGCGGGGGGGRI